MDRVLYTQACCERTVLRYCLHLLPFLYALGSLHLPRISSYGEEEVCADYPMDKEIFSERNSKGLIGSRPYDADLKAVSLLPAGYLCQTSNPRSAPRLERSDGQPKRHPVSPEAYSAIRIRGTALATNSTTVPQASRRCTRGIGRYLKTSRAYCVPSSSNML